MVSFGLLQDVSAIDVIDGWLHCCAVIIHVPAV